MKEMKQLEIECNKFSISSPYTYRNYVISITYDGFHNLHNKI